MSTDAQAGRVPDRVVVVGASVAGIRAAQALRGGGFDGELLVAGAEASEPYDKPPLSKQLLTGAATADEIGLLKGGSGEFELRLGRPAAGLDPVRKEVTLADGDRIAYDAVIIATGVRARTLPGTDRELVRPVRELRDATRLRGRLAAGEPVIVIGGGFIGAEVAAAAATLGVPVTIIERLPAPFSLVLGPETGALLAGLHASHGVTVFSGTTVAGVER
ncbi:MAG: FAD-dependent oxidoreductase, partial [Trebonia sp.]